MSAAVKLTEAGRAFLTKAAAQGAAMAIGGERVTARNLVSSGLLQPARQPRTFTPTPAGRAALEQKP